MADNILRVATEFDVGPLVAGAQQAGAAMVDVGEKMGDASKATLDLLYPTEQLQAAQVETVSTNSELAAAIAALTIEINKLAIAKQGAAGAANGMRSAMGAARVEAGLLDNSSGMVVGGLARVAAQSEILGPLIAAAFPVFAAVALIEILGQVVEWFDKAADSAAGFTKEVEAAEKAAVKASDENLSHATSLAEAQDKLSAIVKEQGRLAEETYGTQWANAVQKSTGVTMQGEGAAKSLGDALMMTAKDPLAPFEALTASIKGLFQAEGQAADYAQVLAEAQRKATEEVAKFNLELDKQAVSLLTAKEDADKAGLTGPDGRVKQIQVEIGALKEKATLEEKIATAEHLGDKGAAAAQVAAEYKYKEIAATKELSQAQQEADEYHITSIEKIIRDEEAMAAKREEQAAAVKKDALEETEMFQKLAEQESKAAAEKEVKEAQEHQAYVDQSLKIDEQAALAGIAAQEQTVKNQAAIDALELQGRRISTSEKERISTAANIAELQAEKSLADQKLQVEFDYLEKLKAIELGGETEEQLVAEGKTEQLAKVKQIDAQIEEAERQHLNTMKGIDQQIYTDQQKFLLQYQQEVGTVLKKVETEFNGAFMSFLDGQKTFAQAFTQLWEGIANQFIGNLLKMVEQMIIAFATQDAIRKTQILHIAGHAAAEAYDALSGIPIVGPVLGAAAAAATFAAVVAFGSYDKGGIVPETGMAELHKDEMVLPTGISQPLTAMMPAIQHFNSTISNTLPGLPSSSSTVNNSRGPTHNYITINHTGTNLSHADIMSAVRKGIRRGELR